MSGSDAPIAFGPYRLDRDRGLLLHGDAPVALRPKAFALICHLAANIGRVVPKDELLNAVWPRVTVTEDSLTQCVRELRKSIGDGEGRLVRTVPARGYLLDGGAGPEAGPAAAPRIAVLRFAAAVEDPGLVLLAEAFAEEVLNSLAPFRPLTVLARASSFALAPEDRAGRETIGTRLNVDYLVEGDMARRGNLHRVDVRLIEAKGYAQLWTGRFEVETERLVSLQDDVARQIANRLVARIEDAGRNKASRKPAASLAAYELLIRGVALLRGYGPGVNEEAQALFEQAIARDPGYGLAHAYLALSLLVLNNYAYAPPEVVDEALELAARGVALDPEEARCHRILGLIRLCRREFDAAQSHVEAALALNRCDADTLMQMGFLKTLRGVPAEGVAWMEEAFRLNPMHPAWYAFDHAVALFLLGDYTGAERSILKMPTRSRWGQAYLIACAAQRGDIDAALGHLARARLDFPGFDPREDVLLGWRFEHQADVRHLQSGIATVIAVAEASG